MNIPELHLREVCKIGEGGETCRYIGLSDGFTCLKHSSLKETLDSQVKRNAITAQGDNCDGPKDTINSDAERKLLDAFGFGRLGRCEGEGV